MIASPYGEPVGEPAARQLFSAGGIIKIAVCSPLLLPGMKVAASIPFRFPAFAYQLSGSFPASAFPGNQIFNCSGCPLIERLYERPPGVGS